MAARSDSDIRIDMEAHLRSAGLPLAVIVEDGVVRLVGEVTSQEERQAAIDLTYWVSGIERVEDELELSELDINTASLDRLFQDDEENEESGWTDDPMQAAAEGLAYFPPTDPPVIASDNRDGIKIASGFASTADEDAEIDGDAWDVGESELVERVMQNLLEDAATSNLRLYASAFGNVVVLTGVVTSNQDAEDAVAVAANTEGVERVVDRTVVSDPPDVPVEQRSIHRQSQMSHVVTPSSAWRATVINNRFRLDQMRSESVEKLAQLENDIEEYGVDQQQEGGSSSHDADIASDLNAAEQLLAEANATRHEIQQIDEALERMREGNYGICVDTGQLIESARLKANPLAIRTVEAQRRFEQSEGQ